MCRGTAQHDAACCGAVIDSSWVVPTQGDGVLAVNCQFCRERLSFDNNVDGLFTIHSRSIKKEKLLPDKTVRDSALFTKFGTEPSFGAQHI